mgnify:CR=1 FL=1
MAGVFLRTYLVHSTYVFLCTRATISLFRAKPTVLLRRLCAFHFLCQNKRSLNQNSQFSPICNYQLSPWRPGLPPSETNNYYPHEIPPRCPSRRSGDRPCLRRAHKGLRRAGHRRFHAVSGWRRGLRRRRQRRRLAVQRRWTTGPIAGDLGIAARRARRLVANGQSEDDARWGQPTLSTAVRGGESPARRGRR